MIFFFFLIMGTISAEPISSESYYKCLNPASSPAWFAGRAPPRDGRWLEFPTVHICKNAPVSEARARKAINYWSKLGYKIAGPVMDSTVSACITGEYQHGVITVDLVGQGFDFDYLAMTRVYRYTQTRDIVAAKIEIQKKSGHSPRVLEHELGHAMGWGHIRRQYHIMHPERDNTGTDSYGLRNKFPVCFILTKSYLIEETLYLD
jgi:hypothetical protein